jgi:hypothetical protein
LGILTLSTLFYRILGIILELCDKEPRPQTSRLSLQDIKAVSCGHVTLCGFAEGEEACCNVAIG